LIIFFMANGIPTQSINVPAFLRQSLFGALSPGELDKLAAQAKVEKFAVQTQVNAAGQTLQYLRFVIEGGLTVTSTHANQKEVLVSTVGPGAWVAWLPCFVQEPLATDYNAVPGSLFIALPMHAVRACFEANPALYPLVIKEIGKRMRLLMEWTTQSALLPPEQRLARLISLLARERKLAPGNNVLDVTQAQLATLVGCSRQSASKLIASLQQRGLIKMGYRKCEVPDMAALRTYADQRV
jgi:CRP/FNR family cyclic AMP-dependent transcriptional regulator